MQKVLSVVTVLLFAAQMAISQTWNPTGSGSNEWLCVASSANGSTLIAGQWLGCFEVSTNAGATWMTNDMTNGNWASVASSADGTKLLAASAYGGNGPFIGKFKKRSVPLEMRDFRAKDAKGRRQKHFMRFNLVPMPMASSAVR